MNDLFVAEAARGTGIADELIARLRATGRASAASAS